MSKFDSDVYTGAVFVDTAKVEDVAFKKAKEGYSTKIHYHKYDEPCGTFMHKEVRRNDHT